MQPKVAAAILDSLEASRHRRRPRRWPRSKPSAPGAGSVTRPMSLKLRAPEVLPMRRLPACRPPDQEPREKWSSIQSGSSHLMPKSLGTSSALMMRSFRRVRR